MVASLALSPDTLLVVERLFSPADRAGVIALLEESVEAAVDPEEAFVASRWGRRGRWRRESGKTLTRLTPATTHANLAQIEVPHRMTFVRSKP